jgi:hypothetical protein
VRGTRVSLLWLGLGPGTSDSIVAWWRTERDMFGLQNTSLHCVQAAQIYLLQSWQLSGYDKSSGSAPLKTTVNRA